MHDVPWAERPVPEHPSQAKVRCWSLTSPERLSSTRADLRAGFAPTSGQQGVPEDQLDRLLLTVEELASNGLRHGSPPVEVQVAANDAGYLIDVMDGATDRPPIPAIDRDPAFGGLGLHLVAALTSQRGWSVQDGRKHVWAWMSHTDR